MTTRRIAALVVLVLLCCSAVAGARPGGGETYSHDSDSGSSGYSGNDGDSDSDSDSDGDGEALIVLIDLLIRYPKLAVSALLVVGGLAAVSALTDGGDWESTSLTLHAEPEPAPRARPALDEVRTVDPDFSPVLFEDFVFRLYATAQGCRGVDGKLDELSPYLSAGARRALAGRRPVRQPVTGVVIGQMQISRISLPEPEDATSEFGAFVKVGVQFEANYSVGSGTESRRFVVEEWLLRRAAGARTKPPDPEKRFPCPNCGAPWRSEQSAGTQKCAFCGAVVDNGRFDWQVETITLRRESANIPGLESDVPEQGTSLPTVVDGRFADAWKAFTQEDPGVTDAAIADRLGLVYTLVNDAWSRGAIATARPVLSDGLADYFQYWVDAYAARGLRNALDDMRLTQHELVTLARDRYYDALTIRIWGTGKDYVVRTGDGAVVRGSRDRDRSYSEYWTLVRSGARRGAPRADATCGSCGAGLSVTMSGRCEHCGSHVTAGEFDWVLSKIEQDEAYRARGEAGRL